MEQKKTDQNMGEKETEYSGNAFEKQLKRRRRRRIVKAVITVIVLACLGGAGYYLYQYMEAMSAAAETATSATVYRVQKVTSGNITTTLSSSGSLSPVKTKTETAAYDSVVESVSAVLLGEVKEGDVLLTLALDEEDELLTELETLEETMESTDRVADTKYIKSPAKGVVKDIRVEPGSDIEAVMAEYGYIARVSLDGLMKLEVKSPLLHKYDAVTVKYGVLSYEGTVQAVSDGVAEIIVDATRPLVGESAEVFTDSGEPAGSGVWDLVSYSKITGVEGYVKQVSVKDNTVISRNGKFCLCTSYPVSDAYSENMETREELLEDIEEATVIRAPFDGRVLEIDVKEGDELLAGDTLLVIQSHDGYMVSLSVDELDIASLKLGQHATVTLDAIKGEFEGVLDYISYVNASTGNVVRYTAEVKVGDIAGALPSMSATCEIVTSSSGEGLLVPSEAVQSEKGRLYVLKAPADAIPGMSYTDTEIDAATLEKAEITIIQTDGNRVLVSGAISENDLILNKIVTTNAVYSSSSSANSRNGFEFGGFGGMGGGMPDMPGMNGWNNNRSGSNNGGRGGNSSRSGSNRG